VASRLEAGARARGRATAAHAAPFDVPVVHTVYVFDDEALYEFSNATIHGVLHMGFWVESDGRASGSLAVYIKSRGLMSRLYLAAIGPFRTLFVYPALVRAVEQGATRIPHAAA
jgi:hypothetical protein